jgi:predicted phage terminase large subunit-like protein
MKSLITNVFYPAWAWSAGGKAGLRFVSFSYGSYLTERDNERMLIVLKSPEFQDLYGHCFKLTAEGKVKIGNDKRGWKFASSVGGVGTGERGDVILYDDPHPVLSSQEVIETTVTWTRETMMNRLNDMVRSAIICIMQRVNEADVSDFFINGEERFEHLLIPMEYEPDRATTTSIGWSDPRTIAGECYWPERFPPEAVKRNKAQGPFAWACTPYESPILMADLSLKPIGEIKIGDEIVGFGKAEIGKKRHLLKTTVLDIHTSIRPIVKVTLDTGEVIRCTKDHKWFTGRSGSGSHSEYIPARIGGELHRVCPSKIDTVKTVEEAVDTGWLAGFFDGEGTVSIQKRENEDGHYAKSTSLVQFTQSLGRNKHICDKLELVLTRLGFTYGYKDVRVNHEKWDACRQYYLTGKRLPLLQKFLYYIKPIKWVDRFITGAYGTKFIISSEKVVSIEPGGEETVYGITTGTGNYVVWGMASSNSQYQQRPEIRGGGILKRDYWQVWEKNTWPKFEYIVASLDPAFTKLNHNDPSGFTIWGVFEHGAMLMYAWRKWLEIHGPELERLPGETIEEHRERSRPLWGLVETVADDCRRFRVNHLLIEAKASGHSVSQEMARLYPGHCSLSLIDPKGLDKVARALRVQPEFSNGQIWAPRRKYADLVIDECAVFPRGRHDDLVDSADMAIWWLRSHGYMQRRSERAREQQRLASDYKTLEPLYPA